jgi:hypothetical protein
METMLHELMKMCAFHDGHDHGLFNTAVNMRSFDSACQGVVERSVR